MKHKHAEVIKNYINGIKCEYWNDETNMWVNIYSLMSFDLSDKVRIKPEPAPDFVRNFYINYLGKIPVMDIHSQIYNLKLIWDGETGELKNAEVIK